MLDLCHLFSWVDPCFRSSDLIASHLISPHLSHCQLISSYSMSPHVISSDVTSYLLISFFLLCPVISPLLTIGNFCCVSHSISFPSNQTPQQLFPCGQEKFSWTLIACAVNLWQPLPLSIQRLRIQCKSSMVRLVASQAMRQQRTCRTATSSSQQRTCGRARC